MSPSWAYGITTVPERRGDLLPRTLASLKGAGFPTPRLFVDGEKDVGSWEREFGIEVTVRSPPNLRTHGNWVLSIYELFVRNPKTDRYAIFQDDFVTYKNLRLYLDTWNYPEPDKDGIDRNGKRGYWNLLSFDTNEPVIADCPQGHWYPAGLLQDDERQLQSGRGAVGLVFSRQALMVLLSHRHLLERPTHAARGWRCVDGGIVNTMNKAGWLEYIHSPSLVQHTGYISSMGSRTQSRADTFRTERFDAMDLVKIGGPGDLVERALSVVGITSTRVSKWLGKPCRCPERKEKLNQLGYWAKRILSGATEQAKEHLEEILRHE